MKPGWRQDLHKRLEQRNEQQLLEGTKCCSACMHAVHSSLHTCKHATTTLLGEIVALCCREALVHERNAGSLGHRPRAATLASTGVPCAGVFIFTVLSLSADAAFLDTAGARRDADSSRKHRTSSSLEPTGSFTPEAYRDVCRKIRRARAYMAPCWKRQRVSQDIVAPRHTKAGATSASDVSHRF
jgi:hypothetical protein